MAASALAIVAILWNSPEVNPSRLFELARHWMSANRRQPVARKPAPQPAMVAAGLPKSSAASGTVKPLSGADSSISPKPLDLILTGTVLGRNANEGFAMLGVARENPQTYAAGAVLANGARLAEIHARYVALERGGRLVRLYLNGSDEERANRKAWGTSGRSAVRKRFRQPSQPATKHSRTTSVPAPCSMAPRSAVTRFTRARSQGPSRRWAFNLATS